MAVRTSLPGRIRLHSPIVDGEEPRPSTSTTPASLVPHARTRSHVTPHTIPRRSNTRRTTATDLLSAFKAKPSPTSVSKQLRSALKSSSVKSQVQSVAAMEESRLRARRSVTYAVSESSDDFESSPNSNFGSHNKPISEDDDDDLDELQAEDEDEDKSSTPSIHPTERGRGLRPRPAASRKVINYDMKRRIPRKKKSKHTLKRAGMAAKALTDRAQIRQEIQNNTKAKQDEFLRTHKDLFLPLLPQGSYLHKLLNDTASSKHSFQEYKKLKEQPDGIRAKMKPYQLLGLSFLVHLHKNGMAGILGDEMGLGKTIQTLALFQYLKENPTDTTSLESRPFLVVCPLGVISNWVAEARKFTPDLKVLRFHGGPNEIKHLKAAALGRTYTDRSGQTSKHKRGHVNTLTSDIGTDGPPDLIVTSWETYLSQVSWFKTAFVWRYLVLDEGHKIKNDGTNISKALQGLKAEFRLLLTGTPLQNDLREMWSLLHWLLPDVFTDNTVDLFKSSFDISKGKVNVNVLDESRRLLEVIMLRRMKDSPGVELNLPTKKEVRVFVPLTPFQRTLYTQILTRETDATLLEKVFKGAQEQEKVAMHTKDTKTKSNRLSDMDGSAPDGKEAIGELASRETAPKSLWMKLRNLVMQLRRCSTHPYLIQGVAPEPNHVGEHVILASGKFMALEKLVKELVLHQHKKILVFSNVTDVLDWSEDLLSHVSEFGRKFKHLRLDGSTAIARRNLAVRMFQDVNSEFKVMLISTLAGGLGINLTAATEAIFLDESWNPQVDIQAEARCHRIGQTKPVTIYKLCSRGTVEEQMLGRIHKKLYLSTKITESMQTDYAHTTPKTKQNGRETLEEEKALFGDTTALKSLIRRGAQTLAHSEIDIDEMKSWNLETFLSKCSNKSVDLAEAEVHNPEEEAKWLSTMEKVECAIFDGQRYDRSKQEVKSYELAQHVQRKDRRVGKNVTVLHESGFMVNKQSMDCADWEAIPTLAGKDPSLAEVKRAKRAPIVSQEVSFILTLCALLC
jgi:SWI/SNF-related matrix-associated actin-dependent regulator of chromatin subfamily A member 5